MRNLGPTVAIIFGVAFLLSACAELNNNSEFPLTQSDIRIKTQRN